MFSVGSSCSGSAQVIDHLPHHCFFLCLFFSTLNFFFFFHFDDTNVQLLQKIYFCFLNGFILYFDLQVCIFK